MTASGMGRSSMASGLSARGLDRAQEKTALRAAELLVRLESAVAASPTMALLLAIMVAGAGQLYLRQFIAGGLALVLCLVLGFSGAIPFALSHVYSIHTSGMHGEALLASWLSSFIGAIIYFASVISAYRTATRRNVEARARVLEQMYKHAEEQTSDAG